MSRRSIRIAAAAGNAPAVQHPIATSAFPVVVHGSPAASGIRPKNAVANVSVAADLRGPTINSPVSAAKIISVVDDRTATAVGVRTVDLASDRTTAAQVRLVVIDLGITA